MERAPSTEENTGALNKKWKDSLEELEILREEWLKLDAKLQGPGKEKAREDLWRLYEPKLKVIMEKTGQSFDTYMSKVKDEKNTDDNRFKNLPNV